MERIGSHHKFCSIMAVISNVISIMLMAIMIILIAVAVKGIPNVLTGTNNFSIFSTGLNLTHFIIFGSIALIIGMVIHEFAHGVQSRANKIRVESLGLMYAVIPLGAFVEMNQEDSEKASLKERMSIYSAGISINFITAIVTFLVFALLMLAPLGNVDGTGDDSVGVYFVTPDSLALDAGIPAGAIITEIDGIPVNLTRYGLEFISSWEDEESNGIHQVTYLTENGLEDTNLLLGLYVNAVIDGSPAKSGGLPNDVIITKIGEEIYGLRSFREFINESTPGDEVSITYLESDGINVGITMPFVLTANGDVGYIGLSVSYSGMIFVTPEYVMGTAIDPTYGQTTITGGILNMLNYPFVSMNGPVPEHCQWWFDAPGGEIFWLLVSFVYWIFWINLLLGITNALPAVPFDGGFLFKGWITQFLNKLDYKDQEARDKIADNVTNAVSGFMIFLLILIVVSVMI